MKRLLITITVFWTVNTYGQDPYNYSVPKIEGGIYLVSSCQNKKILVITLPTQQTAENDTLLFSLDTLAEHHSNTLKIIAVPSFEDHYDSTKKQELMVWYRSFLRAEIIITDGIFTRKTSGAAQNPLFQWLTDISLNQNFDLDVEGPWHKFFISHQGQLYSVLQPHTKISSRAVNKTLFLQ